MNGERQKRAGTPEPRRVLRYLSWALFIFPFVFCCSAQSATKVSAAPAVRVYPNPWRADRDPNALIKFDHIPSGAAVKIFTLSGRLVRTLSVDGTQAEWDRINDSGQMVASGIYLFAVNDAQGHQTTGKLAIIQ